MSQRQRLESAWITVLLVIVPAASGLRARIVEVSESVNWLNPPPADVRRGALQSDTHYFAFDEQHNVRLEEDLPIDTTTGDTVTPGTLTAGTGVSSHLIHTNPFLGSNNCGPDDRVCFPTVTIRFDSEILGFYFRNPPVGLLATDTLLGLEGTLYETEGFRGAGSFPAFESISIQNGNELVLTLNATAGGMDNVRVITRHPSLEPVLRFRRGDCNDDGNVELSDAVCMLHWLFLGTGAPGCIATTNANADDAVNIADPTYLLNHLFLGGPPPPAPFPDCGTSELAVDEALGCEESACP